MNCPIHRLRKSRLRSTVAKLARLGGPTASVLSLLSFTRTSLSIPSPSSAFVGAAHPCAPTSLCLVCADPILPGCVAPVNRPLGVNPQSDLLVCYFALPGAQNMGTAWRFPYFVPVSRWNLLHEAETPVRVVVGAALDSDALLIRAIYVH